MAELGSRRIVDQVAVLGRIDRVVVEVGADVAVGVRSQVTGERVPNRGARGVGVGGRAQGPSDLGLADLDEHVIGSTRVALEGAAVDIGSLTAGSRDDRRDEVEVGGEVVASDAAAEARSIRLCCLGSHHWVGIASISPAIMSGPITSISTPMASCRCSSNRYRESVSA